VPEVLTLFAGVLFVIQHFHLQEKWVLQLTLPAPPKVTLLRPHNNDPSLQMD